MSAAVAPTELPRSRLSDGEWHRMHPLTPLLRGGIFAVVVAGVVISNLRERLAEWLLPWTTPTLPDGAPLPGDPVDYVVARGLLPVVGVGVLVVVVLLVVLFTVAWRFHSFRISDDDVEVRSGVLFRRHRRAPLDRVQGVNLTRPLVARILGLAKLEVVGAGLDANVRLEYLSTSHAEAVRADILRLAAGHALAEGIPTPGVTSRVAAATSAMSAGITGIIAGAEEQLPPESVVSLPTVRVAASHLLSTSSVWLVVLIAAIVVLSNVGTPWLLFTIVPAVLGFAAYWVRSITHALRYSIAGTPDGVRITFGLFTTVTEILPPGRVHAIEVHQPLLWRSAGWWRVSVNRLSGRGVEGGREELASVLPVGRVADAERVVSLLTPGILDAADLVFARGIFARGAEDPFTTTPRRARILRPFSWRRNGCLLAPGVLVLRRGILRRRIVLVPLARMQSIALHQDPLDRALRVATLQAHTIAGPVSGRIDALDRDDALDLFDRAELAALDAAATDRSHRWAR
ncbi:PH domain-containing protein [Microbacterium sp. X-17]|uniref:PH domain-containing protein n=1 Tax=Microbacterium sp. X-17 TaxID=3144404 RepID=UPI0031F501F0